jgi:hypothetical protein
VEPNENATVTQWIQSNMTDFEFLTDRMRHYFIGQSGAGEYRLYCRDNQIHFQTVGYTGQKSLSYTVNYLQYGNLSELEFDDNFYELMLDGGGGATAVLSDPVSGAGTGISANPRGSPIQAPLERPIYSSATTLILLTGSPSSSPQAAGLAQDRFDSRRSNYFSVKFAVQNNPLVQLGDTINVVLSSQYSDQASGNYTVTNLLHELSANAITIVTACRGQLSGSSGSTIPTTINAPGQQVVPNTGAPGNPVQTAAPNEGGNMPVLSPDGSFASDGQLPN